MAKVSTVIKAILITAITASAVYITLLFILPPEVMVERNTTNRIESDTTQSLQNKADDSAEITTKIIENQKSDIPALQMTNMFYSEGRQKTDQTEIISEPESEPVYNTNRFMFLGTMRKEGVSLYMLKDSELDFVFGIPEFSESEGFTMTVLDEEMKFLLITDGTTDYKISMN